MIILNKNISVEENIDDLLYNNDIKVIEYDGFDKVTALSFVADGEKYVALKSCLDEDKRVLAKMHEYEHHKLQLFHKLEEQIGNIGRVEEKVKRETMYDFLPEPKLRSLIIRNGTFDPSVLAEESVFTAEEIGYAERLYYEIKGMEAPQIGQD